MKILCLSDLHLNDDETMDFLISGVLSNEMREVQDIFLREDPDVVVLTGDTVSSFMVNRLSEIANAIFCNGAHVCVTLGNHELWGRTFKESIEELSNQKTFHSNIHLLDLESKFEIDDCVFTGGVLFFDGSMRWSENQGLKPWNGWQDWRIKDVQNEYQNFCCSYVRRIQSVANENFGKSMFICTHHISDERLNGHMPSSYSFYSGVKSILPEIDLSKMKDHFLICGHTHRRVIGQLDSNVLGVNVGSDYGEPLHFIIDTKDFRV